MRENIIADLSHHLDDLRSGKTVSYHMKVGDIIRISGIRNGPPPYGYPCYMKCQKIFANNAQYEFYWEGAKQRLSSAGSGASLWVGSDFQIGRDELEVYKGFLGFGKSVHVQFRWLSEQERLEAIKYIRFALGD